MEPERKKVENLRTAPTATAQSLLCRVPSQNCTSQPAICPRCINRWQSGKDEPGTLASGRPCPHRRLRMPPCLVPTTTSLLETGSRVCYMQATLWLPRLLLLRWAFRLTPRGCRRTEKEGRKGSRLASSELGIACVCRASPTRAALNFSTPHHPPKSYYPPASQAGRRPSRAAPSATPAAAGAAPSRSKPVEAALTTRSRRRRSSSGCPGGPRAPQCSQLRGAGGQGGGAGQGQGWVTGDRGGAGEGAGAGAGVDRA